MKKNDIIDLKIETIVSDGNGLGKYEGMAVFVPFTAKGDEIKCKIVKVNKTSAYGIIDKIITPSPDRTESLCENFPKCGGCAFFHISYESELTAKSEFVTNAFTKIGGFKNIPYEGIVPSYDNLHYRNKAQYPLAVNKDGKTVVGFYAPRSHRVIPCESCNLQPEIFSHITKEICKYLDDKKIPVYDEITGKGLVRHIYLRKGYHSGEIMACLIVTKEKPSLFQELSEILTSKFPDIKSFVLNINSDMTNVITGKKCITISGKDYITDTMCGKIIKISPLSFYQVNTLQAENFYECAREYALLSGNETVVDLYCGAGTVGLSMSDKIKKLYGCEIIPEAVENAKENAKLNGIKNAEFYCMDSGKFARLLSEKGVNPDVIITDPPRKGCSEETLDEIIKMSPKKIVMISCNCATGARDVKYLCEHGYKFKRLKAFDSFPRTVHVETVVLMSC